MQNQLGKVKFICTIVFIGTLCTVISSCCSWNYDKEDFEFGDKELKHFEHYKLRDTIYFESNLGDIDTIMIESITELSEEGNRCFISTRPSNQKYIAVKHLPIDRYSGTSQSQGQKKTINYEKLISITKFPLQKLTTYTISFKGFIGRNNQVLGAPEKETIINGRIIHGTYLIKPFYPERVVNEQDIEIIYWTDEYGLTAYKNKSGETWLIKN